MRFPIESVRVIKARIRRTLSDQREAEQTQSLVDVDAIDLHFVGQRLRSVSFALASSPSMLLAI